ncbi:MAG: hypothetical protein H6733_07815 [Alphaproteobacteria bacterium]|nr:hypothetical protein [Alphaproteobacteria bacterium]
MAAQLRDTTSEDPCTSDERVWGILWDAWCDVVASPMVDEVVATLRRYRAGWDALSDCIMATWTPEDGAILLAPPKDVVRLLPRARRFSAR